MKSPLLPLPFLAAAGLNLLGAPLTARAAEAAAPTSAATPEPSAFRWDSGAVLGTGRVWRGQLQTGDRPAVVGEVKLSHTSGMYTGIWAGNLDLGPGTDTSFEFDYFLGWGKRFGKLSLNAGYLYRQRPSDTMSLDFQEVTASVAYDFGVVRPGLGVYHSWDFFQGGRATTTYANLRVPLGALAGLQWQGVVTASHNDFSNRALGNYNDIDLRVIGKRGAWEYSVGFSDTNVDPARSGLLARDKMGARWRAQVLVMF